MLSVLLLLVGVSSAAPIETQLAATVTDIHDGDTFTAIITPWPGLTMTTRIRVAGIDAPELGWRARCVEERQLGEQAKAFADATMPLGTQVLVRNVAYGKYAGRFLADVTLATGEDFGALLVAKQLARPWRKDGHQTNWCQSD